MSDMSRPTLSWCWRSQRVRVAAPPTESARPRECEYPYARWERTLRRLKMRYRRPYGAWTEGTAEPNVRAILAARNPRERKTIRHSYAMAERREGRSAASDLTVMPQVRQLVERRRSPPLHSMRGPMKHRLVLESAKTVAKASLRPRRQ
jgi:hypothetical protein